VPQHPTYLERSSVLDPPVINEHEVFELEVAVAHFLTVHEIDDLRKRNEVAMEKGTFATATFDTRLHLGTCLKDDAHNRSARPLCKIFLLLATGRDFLE
jgi:hypothetical protein